LKVLGFAGSPRRGSNTDILLKEVFNGAESKGAETKLVVIPNQNVMACQNCDACITTGSCPFGDSMPQIYQDLAWADRVVLAAPLHFMGLPSQTKAMIDRIQGLWVKKYVLKKPPLGDTRERWGLFVSVGGRSTERIFEPALATVKAFFASLDIKYAGMVAYAGIDKRAEILNHPEALKEAFAAGERLASPEPLQH
jgi:multimeric flavodoxin WrbA